MKKVITVIGGCILSLSALAQHGTLQNENKPDIEGLGNGTDKSWFPEIICSGETTLETDAGTCLSQIKGARMDVKIKTTAKKKSIYRLKNSLNADSTLAAAIFPKGVTRVIWTVTDTAGHSEQCSFDVIVADREAPRLHCPPDQERVIEVSEWKYYTVQGREFDPVDYSDNCSEVQIQNDYNALVTLDAAVVPEGVTRITWTGRDADGNSGTCSFDVRVVMK